MQSFHQTRIPITTGWGPCKRTHWVPVNERVSYDAADGRTYFHNWSVGLDPGAFGHPSHTSYPQAGRGQQVIVIRDGPDHGYNHRAGGNGYHGWDGGGGGGGGWRGNGWDTQTLNELLDEMQARELQNAEYQEIRAHRADLRRTAMLDSPGPHDDPADNERICAYLDEYSNRTTGPVADERLTELRREAEFWANRTREREEEQERRDRKRERELRDADLGRRTRRELDEFGFVHVAPGGRRRRRW
jgi:hypothetical protein